MSARCSKLSEKQLRKLGRLPVPMVRRKGDKGFRRVSWDDAIDLIAGKLRETRSETHRLVS